MCTPEIFRLAFVLVVLGNLGALRLRGQDCNRNGVPDAEELARGTSADSNRNGIPDECELPGCLIFPGGKTNLTGSSPYALATADLNGDGHLDLATANERSDDVSLLLGNGDGTFRTQQRFAAGSGPSALVAVDLNGDGRVDLATANDRSRDVSVLLGNGDGTFQTPRRFPVGRPLDSREKRALAAADLNGDGRLDLATTNTRSVSVLLGNGDGTFREEQRFAAGFAPVALAAADLNGDRHIDLATANHFSGDISVLPGNGDGTFAAQRRFATGNGPAAVAPTSGLNPDFEANAPAEMAKWCFDDELIAQLREGLRKAGLEISDNPAAAD